MIEKLMECYKASSVMTDLQRQLYIDMHTIRLTTGDSSARVRELYEFLYGSAVTTIHNFSQLSALAVSKAAEFGTVAHTTGYMKRYIKGDIKLDNDSLSS